MMPPLIVLDRDGVINVESEHFVKSPQEWLPIPGSLDAIARLSGAGWRVAIATNQSGVGRGLYGLHELAAIHAKMLRMAAELGGHIDGVFFCPHAPDAGCVCRKPRTGLYDEIARHFGVGFDGVPSIGDSRRDLDAAREAGATPILVRTGNGAATEAALPDGHGIAVYDDLAAAVEALLA